MKNINLNVHLMIEDSVPDYVQKISMEVYILAVTKLLNQTGLPLEEKKHLLSRVMEQKAVSDNITKTYPEKTI